MDAEKIKNTVDLEQEEIPEEEVGDIRIADEVICIVASLAAQEVPGVLSMSGGFADGLSKLLGKENASKGVRLKFDGKMVTANVYIVMEFGYCIPEVALVVQEKVKEAIENMTGYEVQFVDVNIEGVAVRPESMLEVPSGPDEAMADVMRAQAKRAEATENNSFEMQLASVGGAALAKDKPSLEAAEQLADESTATKAATGSKNPQAQFFSLPEEDLEERHRKFLEED